MNDKKIRFILKAARWSAFTAAVYFPASLVSTLYLYRQKDLDIEMYVQENLEQIIEKQEEKLGITYPAERPKIKYFFPEQKIHLGVMGLYDDGEDAIYLPSGLLTRPEWNWGDFVATIATFNNTADAKKILDHELAHFYFDKIKEISLGRDYHIFRPWGFSPEESIADRLINEGIAAYIENVMNGEEERPFNLQDWPSETKQFSNEVIYRGGYTLVKPIIDKYGEKGIHFLLFNPPIPAELFTPKEYQEKAFEKLAKLQ
ncbi:hypothetical protein HY494_00265 [Candidatus Woesearchaeota archaeon]|nr:hypothetical protein [Candidatus Woesearchaeota archaeon]